MKYIHRYAERKLGELNDTFPLVMVVGPPLIGKSTMLHFMMRGTSRKRVSLKDPEALALARTKPVDFFRKHQPPVLVEEAHCAPQLFPVARWLAEEGVPGRIWFTSVKDCSRLRNFESALSGFCGVLRMHGLSQGEIAGLPWEPLRFDRPSLEAREAARAGRLDAKRTADRIWTGGFPSLVLSETPRNEFFESYIEEYVLRHIAESESVIKSGKLTDFLRLCASEAGSSVSYGQMGRRATVSVSTLHRWLEMFVEYGLLWRPSPLFPSSSPRRPRIGRVYFTDTGFASWLAGVSSPEALREGPLMAPLFNNYAIMELLKNLDAGEAPYRLAFIQDPERADVDLVLEQDEETHPFEFDSGEAPDPSRAEKFQAAECAGLRRGPGGIICGASRLSSLAGSDSCIPSWLL